jgi:hypothetical protein
MVRRAHYARHRYADVAVQLVFWDRRHLRRVRLGRWHGEVHKLERGFLCRCTPSHRRPKNKCFLETIRS